MSDLTSAAGFYDARGFHDYEGGEYVYGSGIRTWLVSQNWRSYISLVNKKGVQRRN
jgi:hypothetical protein